MKNLNITVINKIATYLRRDGAIVCGNKDYQITFAFDAEWDKYETKTARFIWNGKYWDQPFSGNVCPVPIITGATEVTVGVYAGDLCTTTPATIPCKRSILCGEEKVSDGCIEGLRDEAVEAAYRAEAAAKRAEDCDPVEVIETVINTVARYEQLKPEFGQSLDWLKTNGDTAKLYVLPDGNIYAYTARTLEGGSFPNFENALEKAEAIDTTDAFEGKGYITSHYLTNTFDTQFLSPSNKETEWVTGFIPYTIDKSIYIKGVSFTTASHDRMYFFADKATRKDPPIKNGTTELATYFTIEEVELGKDYYKLTPISGAGFASPIAYVRMSFTTGDPSKVIISIDNPINYTTVEGGTVTEWADTGHAFVPADYEPRIIAIEDDILELDAKTKRLDSKIAEVQSGNGNIPNGVQTSVADLVNKALSRTDTRILRFLISSDAHQRNDGYHSEIITAGNKELGQAYGEILNLIGVDFVSNLGDSAYGAQTDTTETVKEQIQQFSRFVGTHIKGEQILNCEGNHDDACYSSLDYDKDGVIASTEKMSLSETFSLIYAKNKGVVFDADHYIDGYCYKDFEHLKVRVICLNTEQGTGDGGVVEGYQLTWLEEVALSMNDKTDWSIITLAHHPFSYGTTSLNAVVNIIDAFINSGGKYIGHFHGHAHAFSVVKMQKNVNGTYTDINAWEICIPNACYDRSNQYLTEANERRRRYSTPITYVKTDEDGKRTSFNLVTVCLDKKVIYADNYGAGIDREISY